MLTFDAATQQFKLSTGKGRAMTLTRDQVLVLIAQASDALVVAGQVPQPASS